MFVTTFVFQPVSPDDAINKLASNTDNVKQNDGTITTSAMKETSYSIKFTLLILL